MGHAPTSTLPWRFLTPFTWLCFCSKLWTGLLSLGSGWGCPWDNPATSQGSLAPSSPPRLVHLGFLPGQVRWSPSFVSFCLRSRQQCYPHRGALCIETVSPCPSCRPELVGGGVAQTQDVSEGPPERRWGCQTPAQAPRHSPGPPSPRCTPILQCPPTVSGPPPGLGQRSAVSVSIIPSEAGTTGPSGGVSEGARG